MNSTAAVENHEFTRAKTSVWWDIENCPVPKGSDAHEITQTLSLALMKMNYNGPLSISSYGNTNLIPNSVQQALSSTGVSLNHVPSGRKDASDKKILVDMFLWVMDNPAPANLMLITGDRDFSDALHRLRMRRYNILLAHPQQVSAALLASAKATWLWSDFFAGACPRLLDNAHMLSDCEVVSEQVLPRKPMNSGSSSSRAEGNKLKGIYVPKASYQLMQQEARGKMLQKNGTKTGESAWFCKVCNVACKSFEIFTTHFSSNEHAAQWQLNQNLEVLGEPENMDAAPSECHDKDVEMTNKVIECGVEASAHCDSHAAMVKKQAEAILEAKNVEESVLDNDLQLQSLDAKESIKCLEKQNKEHAEIWIPSEKSGGEFWQDFSERLKSEDGAPLNVDCVFSELSRDLRVPKEVRECFDAILKKLEPSQNENVIKKLEDVPKQETEMKSCEPEDTPGELIEHLEEDMNKKKKKKKSKMTEDKTEEYVCTLCSVICVSPAVFDSHLNGRKHATMIKKQHTEALLEDKKIQEEIIQDNGHLKEMIEELQFQPGEAPETIDCLEKQNKELSGISETTERSVEELCQAFEQVQENENMSLPNAGLKLSGPKEAREWFHAIIKKLELSQDENLTRELESVPNQNLELNSGDPESNSGATKNPEEYMDKKNKDTVAKDEAEREPYVCSICSVICDCPIVFESHLMGRRHAAGLKKHAEVLFDDKKILEESLKEKDHPSDALEELLYQPKETQEVIKEVCQITKERVENESEQLLNLEFAEPKEARERFAELEISLEDTSNQKSCEAEENTSEVGEKRRNNDGAAATQIRVCEWCSVMCSSQVDFDSHLAGKKHAATVKKNVPVVKKHVAVVKKQAGANLIYVRKNGP